MQLNSETILPIQGVAYALIYLPPPLLYPVRGVVVTNALNWL